MPGTRPRASLSMMAIIVLTVLVAFAWPRPAHGAVAIHVTTTNDDDVVNGNCTFREAIQAANTNTNVDQCMGQDGGTADTIDFMLGPGTPRIEIGSIPLPHITEWVDIFGSSGGSDRIEIHGPGGPKVSGHDGLTIDPTAAGTEISSLVINNSADDGIAITADEVTLTDDFIGTDATGMTAIPNQGFGVQVNSNGVRIGSTISAGPCVNDWCGRNLVSGNAKSNILLDIGASGAFVWGNFIGTDKTGMAAMAGSSVQGIQDKGHGDTIGGIEGTTPGGGCLGECNLISGKVGNFDGAGNANMVVNVLATGTRIMGNFIGTDVTGTAVISNGSLGSNGILVKAAGVVIGGTTPAARNIVSGNGLSEIFVAGLGALIEGNYIGTDTTGTAAIPGSGPGVYIFQTDSAVIGGSAGGAGNLISGAAGSNGVIIQTSTNTQVAGNLIGTAADGKTPLPNGNDGVFVEDQASNNQIGGGNTIAFNGHSGVAIDGISPPVRGNSIRSNSIYGNSDEGIALVNSANDGIAPPVITGVGPVKGTACAQCTIEVFSDAGNQGRTLEGTTFSDNSGDWTFSGLVGGPNVTATATDISNNTSQFSLPMSLVPRIQGNVNCDGLVDEQDFEFLLEYAAELNNGETPGDCPDLGDPVSLSAFGWGDVNCDGLVNALDALFVLAHTINIDLPQTAGSNCVPIGQVTT